GWLDQELSISRLVLANRPWRLVRDLSKVLVAIVGSAGLFVVNSNAWLIANGQGLGASMAIVVGAIGSGLETDDEVRDTISRYRPQPYPERQDHPGPAASSSSSDDQAADVPKSVPTAI
ncbi:MAG: hypothetical protein QOF76_1083, partial [Solirubrobacteraceae bacterium]|nr:hypothetical protein [Solirubrobacteraceae bacterium]